MRQKLWAYLFGAALTAVLAFPFAVLAQEEKEEPTKPASPPPRGDVRPAGERVKAAREPNVRTARELLVQVRKLQETMKKEKELKLSDQQQKDVDTLFEAHFQAFKNADSADAEQKEKQALERIEQIRQEMKAAREANEREKLQDLRKEMMDLRETLYNKAPVDAKDKLLDDVAAKLDDNQKKNFLTMSQRLGLAPGPRGGGPLRNLMQILRDPELAVSKEQDEKIRKVIRDQMADMRDPDMDAAARDAAGKRVETAVLAELTPEQKAKYEEKKAKLQERQGPDGRRDKERPRKPGKNGGKPDGEEGGKGDGE